MTNLTTVTLTSGLGSAGTGTISTLDGAFQTANGPIAIKAASTAPIATDPALVVAISPNSVNSNGRKTPANSAPVVLNSQTYATVAASQTAQGLGATGAVGDYLDGILVIPATTSPGNVIVLDNATSVTVFTGGATSVGSLVPFFIPVGAVSASGQWKVTTGANVSCVATGNFT